MPRRAWPPSPGLPCQRGTSPERLSRHENHIGSTYLGMTERLPDAHSMNRPASPEAHPAAAGGRSVPIANENRLVVPDTLGTTIKLTSSASWRGPLAWRQRATASGAGVVTYIHPAVVTCPEIRWPPQGFWFSGPAPCRYSQPRAGRSAAECKHGWGLPAHASTPNDAPMLVKGLEWHLFNFFREVEEIELR